ncbi:uncharacterized mitochondrial protein AtMg00820-like [Nicotiana tomentosiformis]|uniref:uncharacterized mitochondrial protein AtMg00820-like n=1 Tax=Nicotiana tomentosiformis TaxID=4098 RepID=UPI00388CCE31
MKYFVSLPGHKSVPYSIANYVSYDGISPKYHAYLVAFFTIPEPTTFEEVVQDPRWVDTMQDEITALESNHTWDVVSLPEGKVFIGCKWIYKVKYKATEEVKRFKARLMAKRYNQQERIDYQETFSPVVKMVTVRTILVIVAYEHCHIHQMDVYNVFSRGLA